VPLEMTEGNYFNVGHRGPVYKGLGAMNPCDHLSLVIKNRLTIAVLCSGAFLCIKILSFGLHLIQAVSEPLHNVSTISRINGVANVAG
jgi:hypothetical protein